MAKKLYEESNMIEIGRAIQNKLGTSSSYSVPDMAFAILMINTSGTFQSLNCSENGMYMPEDGYDGFSKIVVNVPQVIPAVFGRKTITENGSYSAAVDNIDAFNEVTVSVNIEGVPIKEVIEKTYSIYSNSLVSTIRNNCFMSCYNLEIVNMEHVLSIGSNAFEGCTNLSSISFPICEYIGSNAFMSCSSLTEVYFLSESMCIIEEDADSVFAGTPIANSSFFGYFGSIYVLPSMVDVYKAASCWSVYSERITSYVNMEAQNG